MMTLKNLTKYLLFFYLAIFVVACNKSNDPVAEQKQYFVSATLVKELSKDELIKSFGSQSTLLAAFARSNVKEYKIIYKTTNTDGTEIEASGAFIMPTLTESMALVSMQHGTISTETDAPSYFNLMTESQMGAFLASVGYFVAMPDYIGYGASKNLPHTYEHREGLATASLDLLRAVKEYITTQKLSWNKNLLIAGYSEGGFATLSLQKKLETEYPKEFNLKASSCGAGAYNKTETLKGLLNNASNPAYNNMYLWVLLTYDRIYKLNRSASSYFIEPYATAINTNKQNAKVDVSLNTIVASSFKTSINNGSDTAFLNALKDNDIYDWKPSTPTRLYHGDADDLVPYFNSKTAFDAMKAKGAGTTVSLITLNGKNHSTAIQDYLLGTFEMFSTYNK